MLEDDISKRLLIERMTEIYYHLNLPMHAYQSVPQCLMPLELQPSEVPMEQFFDEDHYFAKDVVNITEHECFVDGGCFTGDTIEDFLNVSQNKFDKIYAFELDPDNYEQICKQRFMKDDRIKVFPYGISDQEKEVMICRNENATEHRISTAGDIEGKAVSMDHILKDCKVTFIKMDIEGEELAALNGGVHIIQTQKPKLAISAYHKASDIFDIPIWITSVNPEYKIYFRHHEKGRLFDTVCYAI